MEMYGENCFHKLKLFISFNSSIACVKTTVYVILFFMWNVNMIFIYFYNFNFNKKTHNESIEHMVNFLKLALRVLKTVLKNQNNLIFKNRLKHLKWKCFSVLRKRQSCSYQVKNGCKNSQCFDFKPLKPFCLSSEQGFIISILIKNNSKPTEHMVNFLKLVLRVLNHSLPIHPFSVPWKYQTVFWCFQGVEKGSFWNEWVKTVLKNKKELIFKNCLKHLKRKCFSILRQKQSCSHQVKNGCENLQRFSF